MLIRVFEMEELLKLYTQIEGLIDVFKLQIENLNNGSKDVEGLVFRRNLDGLPKGTDIIDRTGSVALKNKNEFSKEIKEIQRDLLTLEMIFQKINISIRALKPMSREVIELKYVKGFTWNVVCEKLDRTVSTLKIHKKSALKILTAVSRIDSKEYQKIIKLLEVK